MRVRKAHFAAFVKKNGLQKTSVTDVHAAYMKEMKTRNELHNIESIRSQNGHKFTKKTKIGLTKAWVSLQLRKINGRIYG
jgi:hypothetical protein